MNILVLNCGSSSIKYQFIRTETEELLAKGLVDRIGMSGAVLTHHRYDGETIKLSGEILDHSVAIEYVLAILISRNHGVIRDKSEIHAVGHRVVHGGEDFSSSVLITPDVMRALRENIELAPLHNPHNIRGIEACRVHLPDTPQVGVFDTAFHQTMLPHVYLYGIPYVLYKRYKIRRYGFHGTSHLYVSRRAAKLLQRPIEELRLVTCHLGNGCSMTAVKGGKSVDTSMGFTPLEGLLMGTRSGDLDPSLILYVMAKEELTASEANTMLNKHSGLVGVSGESSDMREIVQAMKKGDEKAANAFQIFCYRVKKYIGAYAAAMGGVDAVIFTGGIGENSADVRAAVCRDLEFLGIRMDEARNLDAVREKRITREDSPTAVYVIPTNEELVIAEDTMRIVQEMARPSAEKPIKAMVRETAP